MTIGVIFDMDGVLVESEEFYFQRRMDFFKEKGLTPGSQSLLDFVGKTDQGIWEMLVPQDAVLRQRLKQEYLEYRETHPIDYPKALRSGTKEVLQQLVDQQIPIGLASSSARFEIQRMLAANQLAWAFSYVISGEDLAESKPHPEIYQKAMTALACERYVAVEDSPLGIQSATAAGAYTVALAQSFPLDQSGADIIISDIRELCQLPIFKEA